MQKATILKWDFEGNKKDNPPTYMYKYPGWYRVGPPPKNTPKK